MIAIAALAVLAVLSAIALPRAVGQIVYGIARMIERPPR